jgi:protein-S-isoprenylcysteine O-methyltransferase Ste14
MATNVVRLPAAQLRIALPSKSLVLDLAERTFILTTFAYYMYRLSQHFAIFEEPRAFLMFCAELIPMAFVVARKPSKNLSERPLDWLFGLAGSVAPLMISLPPFHPIAPPVVWYSFMLFGVTLQLSAKVCLGLSFGVIAANRGVKVDGPYRIIRHPMYAGYTLNHVGVLLAMPSLLNCALYAAAFLLQIVRITREECVLMRDPAYRDFAARVRFRLLPGVF